MKVSTFLLLVPIHWKNLMCLETAMINGHLLISQGKILVKLGVTQKSGLPVQVRYNLKIILIFRVQYSTDTVWFLSIEYPLYSIMDLLHKGLVLKLWACDYQISG